MSKVFILNGPPACGKDTVGRDFAHRTGFDLINFKEPLFRIAASTMGMSLEDFTQCYEDREWKEAPQDCLNGHTVRELLIQISETYIKPFFGNDWFGQQAINTISGRPWQNAFVFTDGGFVDEVEAIADAGHEVLLVHMYREGCDFTNDSRSYVLSNKVRRIYTLNNNGTVDEAVDQLEGILDEINDRERQPIDEREFLNGDNNGFAIPRPRAAGRSRVTSHLARMYGAGESVVRRMEQAEPEPDVEDDGRVERPVEATSLNFEQIIANAERRQREREAERAARAERGAQLTAGNPFATRNEPMQYTWSSSNLSGSFGGAASSSTIVDESEIMSEG